MAKQTFLANIDLSKNELLNAKLQNLATVPVLTVDDEGFMYWNTIDDTAYFWTGYVWKSLEAINTLTTDITVVLSNGKTLGKYVTGDIIPAVGKTLEAVLRDIAREYVLPAFTSFSVYSRSASNFSAK